MYLKLKSREKADGNLQKFHPVVYGIVGAGSQGAASSVSVIAGAGL